MVRGQEEKRRLTDAEAAARWREAENMPDEDGSHYGYHCERCTTGLRRIDIIWESYYGEEVPKDGTILCKLCAGDMTCPHCGHKNPSNQQGCNKCGKLYNPPL